MHEARFELAQVSPSDLKADSLDRSDIRARFFFKEFFPVPDEGRTRDLSIRSRAPYPLGHGDSR